MKKDINNDLNNNNIPDWIEALTTYIIAAISISLAVAGYIRGDLNDSTIKWLIAFAVALSGERDVIKSFIKNKVG